MNEIEKVLITKSSMDAIGDAIRDRNGLLTTYLPSEMPTAIESIPNNYTLADEGKVVKNGALVAQTARATELTANGIYDTTENNSVTVNVSGGGSAVVQPLNVTQNGTYNPPSGVDGFSPVTVSVSGGSSLVEIMHQGQVSDTSHYMTAYFDAGVNLSDYELIFVDLYKNGALIGSNIASPQSLPATFYITGDLSYTMKLSSDSIACTHYSGSYYNLYVNVYGFNR